MKSKPVLGSGFALLFLTLSASASSVPLDSISMNFLLNGGGGGASATLNGVPVEIYCDDFANDMWVPYDYTANVTTLGTSANLGSTRFGGVSSSAWTAISLSDGNPTLDAQDDTFFNSGNGSSALARYEMVAYLVSLYNPALGNNTSNNQIQEAIWAIMDPKAEGPASNPGNINDASYLEQAASWYNSMNTPVNLAALSTFLSRFEIVSPTNMTFTNGLGNGGFQEQIVMFPALVPVVVTPEPRAGVWILFCLLGGFLVTRRNRGAVAVGA